MMRGVSLSKRLVAPLAQTGKYRRDLRDSLTAHWRLLSVAASLTAVVIVYLLNSYYTPEILIPATGTVQTFQIYT